MKLLLRLASRIAPNFIWRRTCPSTIDSIADDFINHHLPPFNTIRACDFSAVDDNDPWFAWRRRICAIYGVATCYKDPRGKLSQPGWNRRLWRKMQGVAPEQLVEQILDKVIERIRTTLAYPDRDPACRRCH